MPAPPFASVVVCTRNRCELLVPVLDALFALDYPSGRWELLVVDNGSTDDTLRIARDRERRRPEFVRIVEEPTLGLSTARNRGIRESRGEIVAFLDDDAFVCPDWLRVLVSALGDEGVLVAGGPVEPLFDSALPDWFHDRFLPYLSAWDRGPALHDVRYNNYPRGANIAFRSEVFERFGGFCRQLGRRGRSLLSCEEIEVCLRVDRAGGRIVYVPDAPVGHVTATDRLTPRWLARRFAAQARSEAIVDWRHAGWRGLRRGWPRTCGYTSAEVLAEHPPVQRPIVARCHRAARRGYLRGLLTAPLTVPRYRPPKAEDREWWPWA